MEGYSWTEARDFVDEYDVMMKNNGNLEVTKWNLTTLKVCKNEKESFVRGETMADGRPCRDGD